jgi:hypothetical protein
MRMKLSMLVGVILVTAASVFQSTNALAATELPVSSDIAAFVPKGYVLIQDVQGDLNRDGIADRVIVIQNQGQDVESTQQRELLVLLGQAKGGFQLAKRAVGAVLCEQCGGAFEPLQDISIDHNALTIDHFGGSRDRWNYSARFAYSRIDRTWQLVHFEMGSYDDFDPDNTAESHVYRPPRDYGKIAIDEFQLEHFVQQMAAKKLKKTKKR